MRRKVWFMILLACMCGLAAHADVTTTVVSSADTGIRSATATYGADTYMYIYGATSTYYMGYVRFDLRGLSISTVLDASLKMTVSGGAPRNDGLVTGRYGLHGLNNVAGNTPQDWDEATLNQSNTGLEVNWSASGGTLDLARLTNLDSDDATGTTETIVNGTGGGYAPGTTITTTGAPLVNFLQSRVNDNGLVTFIIRQDGSGARGYGLATKENATVEYRPVLTITYIPGGASNPEPEDKAVVNKDLLTTLSWNLNQPGIGKCDVYLGTEPNLLTMDKITLSPAGSSVAINDFPHFQTPLNPGTYYWRVDCYIGDPLPSEPNLPGQFWSFTATSTPVVTQQTSPAKQSKFDGKGETAEFTVALSSATPITYAWYRSVDNANNTDADDVLVGTNSPTLTLTNVTTADQGYYYCKATNPGETRTNPARLSIKRLLAHWKLDGDAADASGSNQNGTLFGDPVFAAGVNDKTGQAMVFDGVNDYIQEPNSFEDFLPGVTISVWAKPTAAGSWARFLDFGNYDGTTYSDIIYLSRNGTSNSLSFTVYGGTAGTTITATNAIALNEWQMFVATMDDQGNVVLYKNGLPIQTGTITQTPAIVTRTSNYIGKSNWSADALYAGSMDDIRLYNYALTADNVADMYSDIAGNFCRTKPAYDWDGNCKVDLGDFAIFAAQWLTCGMYPECP